MKSSNFDDENLFFLINGYNGVNSVGMLHEFRNLPVVVLDYEKDPELMSSEIYWVKNCKLLMLGEVVSYEACKLRMIEYKWDIA